MRDTFGYEISIGQQFTRLMVVEYIGIDRSTQQRLWKCRCKCGKEIIEKTTCLIRGLTKSCGICCNKRTSKPHTAIKGSVGRNQVYHEYRRRAKEDHIYFHLSRKNFTLLTSSNCYYCGKPPQRVTYGLGQIQKDNNAYYSNGIDRVNNNKGYIISNCVPCCYHCNKKKRDISVSMARKIVEFIDGNKDEFVIQDDSLYRQTH